MADAPKTDAPSKADTKIDDLVYDWARASFGGGPVAQNTECWNAVQTAIPALIKSIKNA